MIKKITTIILLSYLFSSVSFAEIRGKDRREINEREDDRIASSADGIYYIETVSDMISRDKTRNISEDDEDSISYRFRNGRLSKSVDAKDPKRGLRLTKEEKIDRMWEDALEKNPNLLELQVYGIPKYTFTGYFKHRYDKATTVAEKKKFLDLLVEHFN